MASPGLRARLQRTAALNAVSDTNALLAGLRRDLRDASNHVVAKAAAIAGNRYVYPALFDLLAAYDRLFIDAAESDPLVLGKHAIAQALKDLDYRDPSPFVRGLEYFEPARNLEDRAAGLRATCAHALVACDMNGLVRLQLLVDHLVDVERTVRREVVRAVAQIGGSESVLLLRLKALAGDTDPEVHGECFAALLDLDPRESVAFVARLVASPNERIAVEAAAALAASRAPEALAVARRMWLGELSIEMRRAIVFSCTASPLPQAADFLLSIVADGRAELAVWALSALAASRFRDEVTERARTAAQRHTDAHVRQTFLAEFGAGGRGGREDASG